MITVAFLLFSIAVIVKLIDTTIVEAPQWNERAHRELSKTTVIPPERGNILASNGNILACNLKVYDVKLDLRHNKIPATLPWAKIDSLADSLDYYYPRVKNLRENAVTYKKYSWHTRLKRNSTRLLINARAPSVWHRKRRWRILKRSAISLS